MKSFEQLVKEYYEPAPKEDVGSFLLEAVKEALYYRVSDEESRGPVGNVEKIASDIVKYIKRKYPEHYAGHDLLLKGGTRVLQFTNFGSLSKRDAVIRDLVQQGWLDEPEVKRSALYHRARTRFFDRSASGNEVPITIQLNAGGGAATSGGDYETEMETLMNQRFETQGKNYTAAKEGGSSNNPDITIWIGKYEDGKLWTAIEAKTNLGGADFGQFQLRHDGTEFEQKTQLGSNELRNIFTIIKPLVDRGCSVTYDPEKSGDLIKIPMDDLGDRVERYYSEKDNDFIVINDDIYSSSDRGQKMLPQAKRFRDAVRGGYVRIRVKCHGKSYSTTAAAKFKSIEPSVKYYDDDVFGALFP